MRLDPLEKLRSTDEHRLALFEGLTPWVAERIQRAEPQAVARLWQALERAAPTWHVVGEERQVHFRENYVDEPGFALAGFRAAAFFHHAAFTDLFRSTDLPASPVDPYYILKLAIALE